MWSENGPRVTCQLGTGRVVSHSMGRSSSGLQIRKLMCIVPCLCGWLSSNDTDALTSSALTLPHSQELIPAPSLFTLPVPRPTKRLALRPPGLTLWVFVAGREEVTKPGVRAFAIPPAHTWLSPGSLPFPVTHLPHLCGSY